MAADAIIELDGGTAPGPGRRQEAAP